MWPLQTQRCYLTAAGTSRQAPCYGLTTGAPLLLRICSSSSTYPAWQTIHLKAAKWSLTRKGESLHIPSSFAFIGCKPFRSIQASSIFSSLDMFTSWLALDPTSLRGDILSLHSSFVSLCQAGCKQKVSGLGHSGYCDSVASPAAYLVGYGTIHLWLPYLVHFLPMCSVVYAMSCCVNHPISGMQGVERLAVGGLL